MSQADFGPDRDALSPERVAELVRSLATVMRQSSVTELDLELGSLSLRLRRPDSWEVPRGAPTVVAELEDRASERDNGHVITAPMVGTFYVAPTPSSPPFISAGDTVVTGQTIGIIEAMKVMNEITADRSGIVLEFLVANGQPVEYGSPLIRLASGSN